MILSVRNTRPDDGAFYPTPYLNPISPEKTWALTGCLGRKPNVLKSLIWVRVNWRCGTISFRINIKNEREGGKV